MNEIDPAFFLQMEYIYVSVEEEEVIRVPYKRGEHLVVALSVACKENMLELALRDCLKCEDKEYSIIKKLMDQLETLKEKRDYWNPQLSNMEYYTAECIKVEEGSPLTENVIKQASKKSTPLIVCRKCKFIFSWRLGIMGGGGGGGGVGGGGGGGGVSSHTKLGIGCQGGWWVLEGSREKLGRKLCTY